MASSTTADGAVITLSVDRGAEASLHAQLVGQLRRLILEKRIRSGSRLPSTRSLAQELRLSRATVVGAFEQLVAEGYLEGRQRSGLFVSSALPEQALPRRAPRSPARAPELSARATPAARAFQLGAIDPGLFPVRDWARLLNSCWRNPDPALLATTDPFGWPPLRTAIAGHLHAWRGISCTPEQVIVTSGAFSAISLIAEAAFRRGDTLLMEDPGLPAIRHAVALAGLTPKPVAVDDNGFDPARAHALAAARGALVTPSRQFPLGATLPLARRLALLQWSHAIDGILIEDDFDSEYQYEGAPLPALTSLDRAGSVVYMGSFSKVLSPSLRLGFLVVPERLLGAFAGSVRARGSQTSVVCQPPLAEFIASGAYSTHIRRTRRTYAQRMTALRAAGAQLEGLLDFAPTSGGMHLVANLQPALARRISDTEAAAIADQAGVTTPALTPYYAGTPRRRALLLGFAGFPEAMIRDAVSRLAAALR